MYEKSHIIVASTAPVDNPALRMTREPGKLLVRDNTLDSKVHRANMGPIWGRQDPGGPHVGRMNFAN